VTVEPKLPTVQDGSDRAVSCDASSTRIQWADKRRRRCSSRLWVDCEERTKNAVGWALLWRRRRPPHNTRTMQSIRCMMVDWAEDWCAIIERHRHADASRRSTGRVESDEAAMRATCGALRVGVKRRTVGFEEDSTNGTGVGWTHCEQIVDAAVLLWLAPRCPHECLR